ALTTQTDANGAAGVFNRTTTDVTAINANGSRTETVTDTSSNGTQIDQTVVSTSANGLSRTTTANVDGKIDTTTTDVTVFNTNGSTTETVTKKSNNGTVIGSTITTPPAHHPQSQRQRLGGYQATGQRRKRYVRSDAYGCHRPQHRRQPHRNRGGHQRQRDAARQNHYDGQRQWDECLDHAGYRWQWCDRPE